VKLTDNQHRRYLIDSQGDTITPTCSTALTITWTVINP
jgi:hypothetical protein